MRKSFRIIPLLCLLALSVPSYGDTLWTLSNVVFNDGSVASGSFVIPSGGPLACPAASDGPVYCLGPVSSFGGPTQVGNPTSWSINTTPGSTITTAESFAGSGVLESGAPSVILVAGQYVTTETPPVSLATYYPEYDVPGLGDVGSYVEFTNYSFVYPDTDVSLPCESGMPGCSTLLLTFPVSSLPDLGPGSPETVIPMCTQAYDPAGCGNDTVGSLFANEGGDENIAYADPGELIGTYISGPPITGVPTPEPGTAVLMLTGVGLLGLMMARLRVAQV